MTTTSPRRDATQRRLDILARMAEQLIGAPLTDQEQAGIDRAVAACGITASLALGFIAGTNTDWPEPMLRTALDAFDLQRIPVAT